MAIKFVDLELGAMALGFIGAGIYSIAGFHDADYMNVISGGALVGGGALWYSTYKLNKVIGSVLDSRGIEGLIQGDDESIREDN